jgi:GTPase Era involved in 16S rRNA processing
LSIYKHGSVDLTLTDLPGLVYDNGMEDLLKAMYKRYISKKETIILTVLPANNDLNTNNVISIADEVDPTKERQLYVITKIDTLCDTFVN